MRGKPAKIEVYSKRYVNSDGIDDKGNQIFVARITLKSSVTRDDRRLLLWLNWLVWVSTANKIRNVNHKICKYMLRAPVIPTSSSPSSPSSSEVSIRNVVLVVHSWKCKRVMHHQGAYSQFYLHGKTAEIFIHCLFK